MNDADLQFPSVYQGLFQHSTSTKNRVSRARLLRLFSDCSFSWIGKGQVMICCRISSLSIPYVKNIRERSTHLWQVRKIYKAPLGQRKKKFNINKPCVNSVNFWEILLRAHIFYFNAILQGNQLQAKRSQL